MSDEQEKQFVLCLPSGFEKRDERHYIINDVLREVGDADGYVIALLDVPDHWPELRGIRNKCELVRGEVIRLAAAHFEGGKDSDVKVNPKVALVAREMYRKTMQHLADMGCPDNLNPQLYWVMATGMSIFVVGTEGKTLN